MMPLSKNTLWLFLISCGGDFIPVVACLVGETQELLSSGNLFKFNLNPQMHPVTQMYTGSLLFQMWWETPWLILSFTTYLADAATDALTALLLLQATSP